MQVINSIFWFIAFFHQAGDGAKPVVWNGHFFHANPNHGNRLRRLAVTWIIQ